MPAGIKRPCKTPGCRELTLAARCEQHEDEASLARPIGLRKFRGGLTLVCGPPASGKTTYCLNQASDDDEIVDLDEVKSELSGLPIHKAGDGWLEIGLRERDRRLVYLAENAKGRTWFIVGAPSAKERQEWADLLGADVVVVLETSRPECLRRCTADTEREPSDKYYAGIIGRWWKNYTRRQGDVVIEA